MFIFLLHLRQKRLIYIEYDDAAQIIIVVVVFVLVTLSGLLWLVW